MRMRLCRSCRMSPAPASCHRRIWHPRSGPATAARSWPWNRRTMSLECLRVRPADFECRAGASEVKVNDRRWLVESEFLEIRWGGRAGDDRLHLRALDTAHQSVDGRIIGARADRLHHLPVGVALGEHDRLAIDG